MALLQICIDDEGPRLHNSSRDVRAVLSHVLASTPGPITYLIHGYKYAPGSGRTCPHRGLFSLRPEIVNPRVISWPSQLRAAGVTLAIGWHARGSLREAYCRAAQTGAVLADLIADLHARAPERRQTVMGHSLGARAALCALSSLPFGALDSVLLLSAAEWRSRAEAAMATPAGRAAEILHVTTGENDLYDFLFERVMTGDRLGDRALGTRPLEHPRALTLRLDETETLAALARLGFRIAPPAGRICHWAPYLRPGIFALYRALAHGSINVPALKRAIAQPSELAESGHAEMRPYAPQARPA